MKLEGVGMKVLECWCWKEAGFGIKLEDVGMNLETSRRCLN